jgi:hypothetical protein
MKKEAYYFSHDANAQDDPKLMLLIEQMGMEGFGIFWALIEKLRAERDYSLPLSTLPAFAHRWHTSTEKVQTVVKNYGLFKIVRENFFSVRLRNSMLEKSERAKASISARWSNTNVLQPKYKRITNVIQNDTIKVKEKKVKENNLPSGDLGFIPPRDGMVL